VLLLLLLLHLVDSTGTERHRRLDGVLAPSNIACSCLQLGTYGLLVASARPAIQGMRNREPQSLRKQGTRGLYVRGRAHTVPPPGVPHLRRARRSSATAAAAIRLLLIDRLPHREAPGSQR